MEKAMSKATKAEKEAKADLPIDALLLECNTDRYKLAYAAIRWAKEIKKTENLPDPIPVLVQRAIREILTGKVEIEDIGKLPVIVRMAPPPPPPPAPTLTLNVAPEGAEGI
jgi:DNA-directed RNA polymerase subunit K/omega